jgi:hypothetical protein
MAFDPRSACRVVLCDGGHDDFHAAALAEEPDSAFVSQALGELADVRVRFPGDPGAIRHLGVVGRVSHRHVPPGFGHSHARTIKSRATDTAEMVMGRD